MDWRLVAAGFVATTGAFVGWWRSGAVGGAVLSAAFVSVLFVADWALDAYLYDL